MGATGALSVLGDASLFFAKGHLQFDLYFGMAKITASAKNWDNSVSRTCI